MNHRAYFVPMAVVVCSLGLSGCSYDGSIVPNAADHPANPHAAEAPVLASPAETLTSKSIPTSKMPAMPEMDHSQHSMKHRGNTP